MRTGNFIWRFALASLLLAPAPLLAAAETNSVALSPAMPEVGVSVVRMFAGLAFVLALFFGGVWVFKNWQRVARVRNQNKLNILEARSLGPRQALYVVSYERQRLLVSASPAGIALLTTLPEATLVSQPEAATTNGVTPFAQVLQNVIGR